MDAGIIGRLPKNKKRDSSTYDAFWRGLVSQQKVKDPAK